MLYLYSTPRLVSKIKFDELIMMYVYSFLLIVLIADAFINITFAVTRSDHLEVDILKELWF